MSKPQKIYRPTIILLFTNVDQQDLAGKQPHTNARPLENVLKSILSNYFLNAPINYAFTKQFGGLALFQQFICLFTKELFIDLLITYCYFYEWADCRLQIDRWPVKKMTTFHLPPVPGIQRVSQTVVLSIIVIWFSIVLTYELKSSYT